MTDLYTFTVSVQPPDWWPGPELARPPATRYNPSMIETTLGEIPPRTGRVRTARFTRRATLHQKVGRPPRWRGLRRRLPAILAHL